MGLISQIVTILFTFITRNLFIKYVGMELLGVNGTFASVLGTISLAELGFQSAITFKLYKPLNENNQEAINDILIVFKTVYRAIGAIFIIVSFLLLPFLRFILKGVEVNREIYLYFLLQAAASAFSYFFAYKRALLYADQKDYIAKSLDLLLNVAANLAQIYVLINYGNYTAYLAVKIVQVLCSNLLVQLIASKKYSYLHKSKFNKSVFTDLFKDVKNVFAAKVAGYVYTSTDNLVISSFVSTLSVGYLVNYTTITLSLKRLTQSLLNPVLPSIGHFLVEHTGIEERKQKMASYTFIRFVVASAITIPFIVLANQFVTIWVGSEMILSEMIVVLLAADLYIDFVHCSTLDFINAAGLFKEEKKIEIIGALTNITVSLMLVGFIGIEGVLTGTVISQIVFWIGRSYVAYKKCIHGTTGDLIMYWIKNAEYILAFVVITFLCIKVTGYVMISQPIVSFVVKGCVCEAIMALLLGGYYGCCHIICKKHETKH